MANIDRADWHYGGDYPDDLPKENGGTHIGMYIAWIINTGLASAKLQKYAGNSLPLLRDRKITGRVLLFCDLDEKFFDSLLTKEGKEFTRDYYETDSYITDYDEVLAAELPTAYHVEDSWENYDRIAAVIDQRFARWRQGEKPPISPAKAAQKEAEDAYVTAVLEAAGKDPSDGVAVLEMYLAGDPAEPYRRMAMNEIAALRARQGTDRGKTSA